MANSSPYRGGDYYDYDAKMFLSPSPALSPRGPSASYFNPGSKPARPATRAHFRGQSTAGFQNNYPTCSPRRPSFSPRYSRSYHQPSDHHGESDEDEFIEIDGVAYPIPLARSMSKRYSREYFTIKAGGHQTDSYYYGQAGFPTPTPRFEPERSKPASHTRRNLANVPQRPQTARRPSSAYVHEKPAEKEAKRVATELDAKRHRIPAGYSLKNWDPNEEPIMLLGSVFDANSIGKWIYDWTVSHHGPATPISDMAPDLLLLLIKLAEKIKRAEKLSVALCVSLFSAL